MRGQFLSQDPMFLGDPRQQNLKDPQSLNSYSYANNNPINMSDPSGKCVEDGCVAELAVIGGVAGITGKYFDDVLQNRAQGMTGLQAYYPKSSLSQYAVAAGSGAAAAVASVYSLGLGAAITAGGYAADNSLSGKSFDLTKTVIVGGLAFAGGSFFEWGVGNVSKSLLLKKAAVGGIFDMSSQAVLQNSYNSTSNSAGSNNQSYNSNKSNNPSVQVGGYSIAPASLSGAQFSALSNFAGAFRPSSGLTVLQQQAVQNVINSFVRR